MSGWLAWGGILRNTVAVVIALDATYSIGDQLSGVGLYSREILFGLAAAHPEARFQFCYRPHRFLSSFRETIPPNCRRFLLQEPLLPAAARLFHGLNQRLPRGRLGAKVTTFHDLFVLTGEYSTPEFRERFAAQAKAAAAESDRIICVSEFTATQVHELLGVERSRLRVVHHGARIPPPQPARREKMILHVGALQKRKNVSRLVEAFESVDSDWRLVLAGAVTGFGAAEILRRIETSGCRDRITVLGYVDAVMLANLYARAEVLAFPSLDEGFGIPVIEAMAAGVAVIASTRGALPEVSGDAALLIDPQRVGELAEALRWLTGDEAAREKLKNLGRDRARQFTWERAVETTWSVYADLV